MEEGFFYGFVCGQKCFDVAAEDVSRATSCGGPFLRNSLLTAEVLQNLMQGIGFLRF